MIKKKIAVTTVVACVLLSFGLWGTNILKATTFKNPVSSRIPIQRNSANHVLFDRVEELEKIADLIVVGKPAKNFIENQPVVVRDPEGFISDYYTLTPIEIKKVLKGSNINKEITILEPAVIIEQPATRNKVIWMRDDYSLLQKNSQYLLFLKRVDAGSYSIISINQGKFNLDLTDLEEQKIERKSLQYSNLKAKVLGKYKDIVSNIEIIY